MCRLGRQTADAFVHIWCAFFDTFVLFISMFVLNCWRQPANTNSPAHFLMGLGKLFVDATGYHNMGQPLAYEAVLYHQCADIANWPWAREAEQILWDYFISKGKIVPPTNRTNAKVSIGYERMNHESNYYCGETVYQEPGSPGRYLGSNQPEVIKQWRQVVNEYLRKNNFSIRTTPTAATGNSSSFDNCQRNLRIAMWERTQGTSLRLLTNVDDIRALVAEFTDQPLLLLDTTPQQGLLEQIEIFRSFDILITSHGSHMTNMAFGTGNEVIIEVASIFFDLGPKLNGEAFVRKFISSFGHMPDNPRFRESPVMK